MSHAQHFAIDFQTGHAYKDFSDSRLQARYLRKSRSSSYFCNRSHRLPYLQPIIVLKNAPNGQVVAKHNLNSEHGDTDYDGTKQTSL